MGEPAGDVLSSRWRAGKGCVSVGRLLMPQVAICARGTCFAEGLVAAVAVCWVPWLWLFCGCVFVGLWVVAVASRAR